MDFLEWLTEVRGDIGLQVVLVALFGFFLLTLQTCNLQFGQHGWFNNTAVLWLTTLFHTKSLIC